MKRILNESVEALHGLHETRSRESLVLHALEALARVRDEWGDLDRSVFRDARSRALQEPSLLCEQIPAAGIRIVRSCTWGVLQRTELLVPRDFEDEHAFREGEHIEHEQLELDTVGLGRLGDDLAIGRAVGNLLVRDVERHVVLERLDLLEKGARIEVVRDVRGAEGELARLVWVDALGLLFRDFAVFYDAEYVAFDRDDAYGFGGGGFGDDFGGAVCVFGDGGAEEDGIGDTHETVVYGVCVDILDVARF